LAQSATSIGVVAAVSQLHSTTTSEDFFFSKELFMSPKIQNSQQMS
jgi:hypothetical protein